MKGRIKITADSTCDLSKEVLEKYDITLAPLYVYLGDEVKQDGVTIKASEVFEYFDRTKKLAKTSAVSQYDYMEIFKRYTEEGYQVIHINLSSHFSSCYQNACLAAEEIGNVWVVDSKNLSTASGLLVLRAAELVKEGWDAPKIVEELEKLKIKVESSFIIDTLDYLHKGGRCSSVAALGANLLSLKPCIEVKDGKMEVGKKYRGAIEKSIKSYVADRLKDRDDIDTRRIFVTHTGCSQELIEAVKENVRTYVDFEEVLETVAGCTISSHCGPNTLGIMFVRK